ncbi:MAG: hypothetical protein IT458_12740 [Planctomycetes bacterium]|nr:hypothetical protein [Planctomycetota bacterium]
MIMEVKTSKGTQAITSDQWHVIHSHFTDPRSDLPFLRGVSSEHPDRSECVKAAKALLARLESEASNVPAAEKDEVFVRRPGFKSLRAVKRRRGRQRRSG